jgi:hypothetical protein
MDDKKLYIIAIVSSILLYLILLLTLLYYISSSKIKVYDALNKETVIELDLVDIPALKKNKDITKPKQQNKSSDKAKKIVKKSTSKTAKRTSNIKSLFGKTKIKAAKISKKEVLNIRSSMTNSRFRSKFEKEKKSDDLKVSNNLSDVKSITNKKVSLKSNQESDPYYSKIYKILSSRFIPRQINDDLSSKVIVTISLNGEFNYKIIQYSDNEIFNQQLINFLDNQTTNIFPIHKNKNTVSIEIIFKTKK